MGKPSLYVIFSLLSIVVNIGVQSLIFLALGRDTLVLMLAMSIGTIFSFAFKYIVDKKYVFNAKKATKVKEAKRVALYSFFSIFTTLLYISVESVFHVLFADDALFGMKEEIGALIGLASGYILKYNLDKKITFKE